MNRPGKGGWRESGARRCIKYRLIELFDLQADGANVANAVEVVLVLMYREDKLRAGNGDHGGERYPPFAGFD